MATVIEDYRCVISAIKKDALPCARGNVKNLVAVILELSRGQSAMTPLRLKLVICNSDQTVIECRGLDIP